MTPPTVLEFRVLGVAIPYQRVSRGARGGVFRDRDEVHWSGQVRDAAVEAMERAGWKTVRGAVRVDAEFVLIRRPTKRVGKGRPHGWPIAGKSVGDRDNLDKVVLDALQKAGVYANDAQVCRGEPWKRWQRPDEEFAGVVVRVEVLG